MVKTMLYCSEQIAIPEIFPNILKTYAKAAIRTQPYDLLRWSSAYFRCLANDVPPPVKARLEKDCKYGKLTKGYLRVLLDQVGKGYFITRRLLQRLWAALCLPEEELLKYLSVCRMLNWPQVHWLKLFAVMVGSLNETPLGTMNMICELLTDDVEGGRARIPIWMFRVCYTFVAELDCSEEQSFVNGRKKLPSGDLEEEHRMGKVPQVFSATSLRQAIFDNCQQRYNTNCRCHEDYLVTGSVTGRSNECPVHRDSETSIASEFKFIGNLSDPTDVLRRYNDFDSLILLLREAQGAVLHDYEGPFKITQKNIEHSKRREEAMFDARERQGLTYEADCKRFLYQEKLTMLREVGPPWSWLHQFAEDTCMDKSYNFIEEQSIVSDVTPTDSSDESFDFCRQKPTGQADLQSPLISEESSSEHASELIREDTKSDIYIFEEPTDIIKKLLNDAEKKKELDVTNSSSVITFFAKEELAVLEGAGKPAVSLIDVRNVIRAIETANENGVQFRDIDDIMQYLKRWKNKEKDLYYLDEKVPAAKEVKGKTDSLPKSEVQSSEESAKEEEITHKVISEGKSGKTKEHVEDIVKEEDTQKEQLEVKKIIPEKMDTIDREESLPPGEPKSSVGEEEEDDIVLEEGGEEEDVISVEKVVQRKSDDIQTSKISEPSSEEGGEESATSKISEDLEATKDVDTESVSQSIVYAPIDEVREEVVKPPMTYIFADSGTLPEGVKIGQEGSCTVLGLMDKEEELDEEGTFEEEQSDITPSGTVSGRGDVSDSSSKHMITDRSEDDKRKRFRAYTCQHSDSSDSLCSVSEGFCCTVPAYPGIGPVVSKKTIQDFVTYLKMRSRCQKGMIMPNNFKEEKCPRMTDSCNS